MSESKHKTRLDWIVGITTIVSLPVAVVSCLVAIRDLREVTQITVDVQRQIDTMVVLQRETRDIVHRDTVVIVRRDTLWLQPQVILTPPPDQLDEPKINTDGVLSEEDKNRILERERNFRARYPEIFDN